MRVCYRDREVCFVFLLEMEKREQAAEERASREAAEGREREQRLRAEKAAKRLESARVQPEDGKCTVKSERIA